MPSLIPLGLPGIVMAVALIQFWLAMPIALYGTLAILLLAYVGRYIPLGVRAANASLRQIDPSLEESAQILGASWMTTMREITLPLIRPGPVRRLAAGVRAGDPGAVGVDPAVLVELDHAGGRGLQPLRDRLYRAGRRARHDQHGDHRRRHLARATGSAGGRRRIARRCRAGECAESWPASRSADCRRASARRRRASPRSPISISTIKDNSFVTLLGPSGCGKTTTLRLIAGYIVPDEGTIEVDGRVLSSPGAVVPPEARGMGMVFQNYAVWPHKTVFENVVFGLKLRKVPRADGDEAGRGRAGAGQPGGPRRPLPERAVRRPAAARRARALAGGRAVDPAARRAAVQSRRQAARAHAHRAQGAAAPHRHHLRLRHPRPGRGAGAVRPDRGDERRPAAAVRHAVRGLRAAGQPHGRRLHGPGESGAGQGARGRGRRGGVSRSRADFTRRARRRSTGSRLATASRSRSGRRTSASRAPATPRGTPAKITNHVFLGNISEYYVALPSGQVLRVQTHPLQQFEIGDERARSRSTPRMQRVPRATAAIRHKPT